jgi:hypothetical protein
MYSTGLAVSFKLNTDADFEIRGCSSTSLLLSMLLLSLLLLLEPLPSSWVVGCRVCADPR